MPALPRSTLLVRLALVAVGLTAGLGIVLIVASTQSDQTVADCRQGLLGEAELQELLAEGADHQVMGSVEIERQWALIAEARRDGISTIIAYVNGLPVTKADIEESRVKLASSLESTRDIISRMEADFSLDRMPPGLPSAPGDVSRRRVQRAPIPESYDQLSFMTSGIERIEQHGVDTVLLAGAVSDLAQFTAATDAGHICDDADIAAWITQTKTLMSVGKDPNTEGYLSALDEELFFTELLPGRIAQQQAVASWRREIFDDVIFPEDPRVKWHIATKDAYLKAQVTLTNEWYLDATLEDATAYMEVIWAVSVPPTPSVPTPDWTPVR